MNFKMTITLLFAISISKLAYAQQSYFERYADVLSHYNCEADSLKYRAAVYLIRNMDGHFTPEGSAMDYYIQKVASMKRYEGIRQLASEWLYATKIGNVEYLPDSAVVNSACLINNIDDAFKTWETSVWKNQISFDLFCEYILPYRVSSEHLSNEWRKTLRDQYKSLIEGICDVNRAFAIIKDSVFKSVVLSNAYCPYALDPVTCQKIGRAECGQRCILLVSVLRSLGIPSVIDATPMWADYSQKSHAWVALVASDGSTYTAYEQDTIAKQFNHIDASSFLPRYTIKPEDNCPYIVKTSKTPVKIYRTTFKRINKNIGGKMGKLSSPFIKDVSDKYGLTGEVIINAEKTDTVYLCSFLTGIDWKPVAFEKAINGEVTFHNVGKGAVCVAAVMNNGKLKYISCPFKVGENGVEKEFHASLTCLQSIRVDRKYPLCSYTTDTWGYMRGGVFEGAMNRDFSDADTLAVIKTMPYGMMTIDVPRYKKYRFLRYCAPENNRSSLAELQFYTTSESGKERLLNGAIFSSGVDQSAVQNIFDESTSTICRGLQVGYTVGIDLGEEHETNISKIRYCPSTDLNFIEKGHLYELYYFDAGWHLVRRVFSKGTFLEFDNVPCGALLLLRDKSKGVEERIFDYVDNQQIWY